MPQQSTKPPIYPFLSFIRNSATTMRSADQPPKTLEQWQTQKQSLRKKLLHAWGGFPKKPCALEPRTLGTLERDGYRVEKVVFQTRPGVLMTANAYVPAGKGKRPAVLCVHGHWRGAKQDPVVQSRCIGLAKLGFFVLVVDALGAGERGIGKALGEYHGEMVAATLWPTGLSLSGLQVYENMRAVDYLQSRPEVDAKNIGITGASGGGNQTMYAGAFDERIGCVVPTCSVGTYQAYLGAACCMCEVVPGAMQFTEEAGLLAMVAPRALMLINATRDAFQFSPGEAKKSLAAAREVFDLYGKSAHAKHAIFESPHAYNQPMREAMYGWMTLHLKGKGQGDPIPEPEIKTEDPATLRCFPGESRSDKFITLPQLSAAEARRILKSRAAPAHLENWEADRDFMLEGLTDRVLGRFPQRGPLRVKVTQADKNTTQQLSFESEPGVKIAAQQTIADGKRLVVLLDLDGGQSARESDWAKAIRKSGRDLITLDLRATGESAYQRDSVARAPDHNTAEWSMWLGRPLLGQWTFDVTRLLDAIEKSSKRPLPSETAVIGLGGAGLVAILAAAFDRRIKRVAAVDMLAGYVSETPYKGQRLGIMAPGILRDAGDIPHLASLVAPRRLLIAGGRNGTGDRLSAEAINRNYAYTRQVFSVTGRGRSLTVTDSPAPQAALADLYR